MCFNLFMYFLKNDMKKLSLHHMLIVFDSKSSLTHYTFDKIKFLSQLHICIALLNILFLKFYVQKLTCCSWKLGFQGIIFSARKLRECRILHHLPQSFWGPSAAPRPPSVRPPLRGEEGSWPSTRFLNRFEYTSFWGSYAPACVPNVASLSGLSILDSPPSVFVNVYCIRWYIIPVDNYSLC
jgi:hypothetical protein